MTANAASLDSSPERLAVARVVQFFEALLPADVARMGAFYSAEAFFKDPFNEVRGLAEVQRVFSHMYVALEQPHFVVTGQLVDGRQCFLTWDFIFRFKRFSPDVWQTVRGGSHLTLDADGLIESHRDYWDAAEELYEKLPVVGSLMRWLKRRANPSAA
jgi:hypothetical protein